MDKWLKYFKIKDKQKVLKTLVKSKVMDKWFKHLISATPSSSSMNANLTKPT